MKFNNFVKYAGSEGMIIESNNGEKWLLYGQTGMKIPETKNICGRVYRMPEYLEDALYNTEVEFCQLESAFVPNKDSKPSALLRRFSGEHYTIDIPNKIFGFIEISDLTYIVKVDEIDESYMVLLVTDDYDEDPVIKMFYIVKD